ncbi:hypothetical protein [Pandoraea anhela]|uniref:Oxygen-regulated invasion protein OrgB n=1 Tax=Pandoraea anhela TaxID=2508295 RepID=A0A5E4SNR2_9BURK|nr:hypothetical protein [Pandoraea anhela]VVD77476.1 Oxygen-regulated invasion protein OrgB [Pandoraea anhela]
MPRSIPIPPQTPVIDGVVVARDQLARGVVRMRVDNDIRHWARQYVVRSQREIDALRRQAMRDGYRDGVAAALGDVVAHLMRTEQMCDRWRTEMIAQMRELLSTATQHPQALLAALDDAMNTFAGMSCVPPGVPLIVVLPARLKPQSDDIRARIGAVCAAPLTLEFRAAHDRISVQRGGAVIEYDPQDYVARAEAALDIDPHVPRADLSAMLASALASLRRRVDELNAMNESSESRESNESNEWAELNRARAWAQPGDGPFAKESEDDDRD